MVFIYLVILAISLVVIQYLTKYSYWRRRGIKGPTPLPFFGNTLESFFRDIRDVDLGRPQKYGQVYGLYMGTIPVLTICDPEIIKHIAIKDAQNFTDVNAFRMRQKFFKDSFILKKGKEWKEGRNLVTPIFTSKRIKDIFPQIQKASKPFFENVEAMIREGKADQIDVKKFAKGYSLDIIGRFVFAFDLNSARDSEHPFVFNARNLTNFKLWKLMLFNILPRGVVNALDLQILDVQSVDYMGDLIMALVKQRRENKQQQWNDFLEMIVNRIDENQLNVTNDEIIAHCVIFFFAGIETVAMTLSHALYCLATYPEEQRKLYADLKRLYPTGEIDYEHLHDSDLLEAFINESQRLYPALNRLTRVAENAIEIKGLRIDKGQAVGINVYALHMDPDFWSEPSRFQPERWLEPGFKAEDENAIHFAPFGAGIRKCVAARMATVQVKYLLMRIILSYEIFKTDRTQIHYMKNPMAMTFTELLLGFKKRIEQQD